MTYPMEHNKTHDWELNKNQGGLVNLADASDQASQGKRTGKPPKFEWYTCKNCHTAATKWLDNTFPELKNKYVFNPSGGTWIGSLGNGYSCEQNVKFQAFGTAAEEFLEATKDVEARYILSKFRERCVHFIVQSWVNRCDHPDEYLGERGMSYGEVLCIKCGGIKFGTKNDKEFWQSDWCWHEKKINGYLAKLQQAYSKL